MVLSALGYWCWGATVLVFLSTFGSKGQFCGPFSLWVLVLGDNSFDGPFIVSALGYWFWGTTALLFVSALIGTGYWFRGTTIDVPNNLRVLVLGDNSFDVPIWGARVLMFFVVVCVGFFLGGGGGGGGGWEQNSVQV